MGLAMQMVAGDGLTVTAEVTLTDHHQGAPGLVHGGLVAVALDEVLGGLGWLLQTPMVTGRLQVEYLRPVPVGTDLHLESQVVAVEGRRIFCQATMREAGDGQRRDLARAFAVFVAVEVEHFRRHGRAVPAGARAWEVNP
jgi:acyl-coenzyme A thioesterase PaaI-like protein